MTSNPPAGTEPVPLGQPVKQAEAAPPVDVAIEPISAPAPVAVSAVPADASATPGRAAAPPNKEAHEVPAQQHRVSDTTHPSTESHPDDPTAPKQAPTASIDPNIPSSQSAPTALPTNPNTHPAEQKASLEKEHPQVVKREVEKTKAAQREIKGERPLGTVVRGIEDDRLYAMLRRFDTVSLKSLSLARPA